MKNNPPAAASRQNAPFYFKACYWSVSKRCHNGMAMLALGFLILHSSSGFRALGQSYSIDWYKVSGGAGTSTGGAYSLTGGYWAIYAVQTAGAPTLTIAHAGNQAIVSWPPSVTGWTLQTNINLATPTWGNYLGTIVNNTVTNSPPKGNLFFRWRQRMSLLKPERKTIKPNSDFAK